MAETVQKSIIQEGIEIGEAISEARWGLKYRIQDILTSLRAKFQYVPDEVVGELNKRTDATALESLVALAATCTSLDEFSNALK